MSKDNIWQWDETANNNSDIAGVDISGATGKVKVGDNAMRAIMAQVITSEGKGSNVASAGTLTLSGAERYFHVTGTTTITDIDFADAVDGRWAWLIFDASLTLTHSNAFALPGLLDIVTAVGDRALFVQDSGDNVICLVYERARARVTETDVPSGSATSLTTTVAKTIASVTLDQPGLYQLSGNIFVIPAGTVSLTIGAIGTADNTLPTAPAGGAYRSDRTSYSAESGFVVGSRMVSVSTTTTYYLIASATFTSTATAYGHLTAVRID